MVELSLSIVSRKGSHKKKIHCAPGAIYAAIGMTQAAHNRIGGARTALGFADGFGAVD
jgi:hypothetical protein